jgi:hypothetical protein
LLEMQELSSINEPYGCRIVLLAAFTDHFGEIGVNCGNGTSRGRLTLDTVLY